MANPANPSQTVKSLEKKTCKRHPPRRRTWCFLRLHSFTESAQFDMFYGFPIKIQWQALQIPAKLRNPFENHAKDHQQKPNGRLCTEWPHCDFVVTQE